jgi:hypothetical protein
VARRRLLHDGRGLVGALCAAVPGFIDMLSLPSGLKRIALIQWGST